MAILSLVVPVLVVIVHIVFEQLLKGSWKTMETATVIYFLLFITCISGLYLGIRALRAKQKTRIAIIGVVLSSIVFIGSGFILLFGIVYVIST